MASVKTKKKAERLKRLFSEAAKAEKIALNEVSSLRERVGLLVHVRRNYFLTRQGP